VLFFTEARSVVGKQRRFYAHFQTQWAPSFKTIHKLYNQFNNDFECWRGNIAGLQLCVIQRTLMLSELRCKKASKST
jgi:hypothetical protein